MPWSYAIDDDSEDWRGSCETREAAIEEAMLELADDVADRLHDPDWKDIPGYPDYEPHFYVGFGERKDSAELFDAEDILERASEWVLDNVGDDDEPLEFVSGTEKEIAAKLQELLDAFAREHLRVRCWTVEKVERVAFPLDRLPKEEP